MLRNDFGCEMKDYAIRYFDSSLKAREYRHNVGCGGWIFEPDDARQLSILFPPHMSPSCIFLHPATRGRSGRLISNQ